MWKIVTDSWFLPGNFSKSMHFSEGSYEKIAERFFKTLNYDTFYLEYDNLRSGGFEPLRFLPVHKNVVLGVVTTKVRLPVIVLWSSPLANIFW